MKPSRAETIQQCQLGRRAVGRGMAETVLHRCRKATLTQRHQHAQQNTDLLEFRFPELLLALQMRTQNASSHKKVCAPQKAAIKLQLEMDNRQS